MTLTAIAGELGRSVSTISREVRRNSGPNGYRAAQADRLPIAHTAPPRLGKLADHPVRRAYVEEKLNACRAVADRSGADAGAAAVCAAS